ncbi:MAG: phosphatase PAP2 family protein [Acidimicrobiales bacterium]|nr:phosphatase PAP2 family protein [Acidimicrobiales bacterium]
MTGATQPGGNVTDDDLVATDLTADEPGIAEVAPSPADAFAPVAAFDAAVDRAFDQLRGHPVADRVMYGASALGDFSLIWALLGSARSLRSERDEQAFLRLVVCLAGESLLVNQGIKRLFRRTRPEVTTDRPHHLRAPLTTSFPSGHASSGAFAAVLLSDGSRIPAVWFLVALVVASSRIHVRIHHASDIVAGAALGTVLGIVVRRLWRLPTRR